MPTSKRKAIGLRKKYYSSGNPCFVQCCTSTWNSNFKEQGITFHKLPELGKSPEIYAEWKKKLNFKENLTTDLCRKAFICSRHFDESCFNRTDGKVELKHDAVPSIFPDAPIIQKVRKCRKSCAVLGCDTNTMGDNEDIFFEDILSLPENDPWRKCLILSLGRDLQNEVRPLKKALYTCSRHFEASCIQKGSRKLKYGCVPTLHLPPNVKEIQQRINFAELLENRNDDQTTDERVERLSLPAIFNYRDLMENLDDHTPDHCVVLSKSDSHVIFLHHQYNIKATVTSDLRILLERNGVTTELPYSTQFIMIAGPKRIISSMKLCPGVTDRCVQKYGTDYTPSCKYYSEANRNGSLIRSSQCMICIQTLENKCAKCTYTRHALLQRLHRARYTEHRLVNATVQVTRAYDKNFANNLKKVSKLKLIRALKTEQQKNLALHTKIIELLKNSKKLARVKKSCL